MQKFYFIYYGIIYAYPYNDGWVEVIAEKMMEVLK